MLAKAHEVGLVTFGLTEHMPRLKDCELYPEEVEVQAFSVCIASDLLIY